jgi:hypothetical protein
MKCESVKPVEIVGSRIAPGSCSSTNRRHVSYSGVSIGAMVPPVGS